MFDWVRQRSKMILLFMTLAVLLFIMAEIVIYSGLLEDRRTAKITMSKEGSGDSPQSIEYFTVTDVHPDGTGIEWNEVKILVSDGCTGDGRASASGGGDRGCSEYNRISEERDYEVVDRDFDGRVSMDDTVRIFLEPGAIWNKEIIFKWKETGTVLYRDRLPNP